MSSERLPPAIDLVLGGSRALAAVAIIVYGAAITALWLSGLAWPWRVLFTLLLGAFGGRWIAVHGLRLGSSSLKRFVWQPEGECILVDRDGKTSSGAMLPEVFVSPALVTFRIRHNQGTRTVVVVRDAAEGEMFRRLRVRLNLSSSAAGSSWVRKRLDRLHLAARRKLAGIVNYFGR